MNITDFANRPPRGMRPDETIDTGRHRYRLVPTPQLPHGWDAGVMFEEKTGTLLSGDLFTQPGSEPPPITEGDILGPSEAFRAAMDYYSHTKNARPLIERLAAAKPTTLACMHGSAWKGDGAQLLRALGDALGC